MKTKRPLLRQLAKKKYVLSAVVLVVSLVSIPWLVGDPCPKQITIASGSLDGAYYWYAMRYKELLAKDGIALNVLETRGSVDNLDKLGHGDADIAFLQGGIYQGGSSDAALTSIASLYQEPIWVFYRGGESPKHHLVSGSSPSREQVHPGQMPAVRLPGEHFADLAMLQGKRIAIGPEGSGTRVVAKTLLEATGVIDQGTNFDDDQEAPKLVGHRGPTSIRSLGGKAAKSALLRGEIDAAFFVLSPESQIVHDLLQDDEIELMDFGRSTAYCRQLPFLSSAVLTQGLLDLEYNVPRETYILLAPTANLVSREDLHPALVRLLVKVAKEVHAGKSVLAERGRFPNLEFVDIPVNKDARTFFESGPSPFYKYVPFGIAVSLDRIKLLILPLVTLLFPILKFAPPVYRWSIRSKIYRWYRVIRKIETQAKCDPSAAQFAESLRRLSEIELELDEVSVPVSYMSEFYEIRIHLSHVRQCILKMSTSRNEISLAGSRRNAA